MKGLLVELLLFHDPKYDSDIKLSFLIGYKTGALYTDYKLTFTFSLNIIVCRGGVALILHDCGNIGARWWPCS